MEIGMIGLGRMGGNMVMRLLRRNHRVLVYDHSAEIVSRYTSHGAVGAASLEELLGTFEQRPRVVWVMVPAGDPTSQTIRRIADLGDPGDIVIDGGNSNWKVALEDAALVTGRGLHYLDAGTSGGIWGLEEGYSLMVGGDQSAFDYTLPLLQALAPDDGGLVHTGPKGSGHFVKMVHNGIEYGVMAAYAEGLGVLRNANIGKQGHASDAETTPLRDHEHYQYDLNLRDIAEVWRRGSVIASWLLDLTATALVKDPELSTFAGRVSDSGEGRWTIKAAIDETVPVPVLSAALYQRFSSRGEADFQDKLLSAMRYQFGGHLEKVAGK